MLGPRRSMTIVLTAVLLSGCTGDPVPPGAIWRLIGPAERDRSTRNGLTLETRIRTLLTQKLPASHRGFNDYLESERFKCDLIDQYNPRGPNTVQCVYFERGPISDNACEPGVEAAVSLTYSERDDDTRVTAKDIDIRAIYRRDHQVHASGVCLDL